MKLCGGREDHRERKRETAQDRALQIFAQGCLGVPPPPHSDQLMCVWDAPKAKKTTTEKDWVEESQSSQRDGDSSSYLPEGRKHSEYAGVLYITQQLITSVVGLISPRLVTALVQSNND